MKGLGAQDPDIVIKTSFLLQYLRSRRIRRKFFFEFLSRSNPSLKSRHGARPRPTLSRYGLSCARVVPYGTGSRTYCACIAKVAFLSIFDFFIIYTLYRKKITRPYRKKKSIFL